MRANCYATLFRVLLRGVGFRCVSLAQNISARCKRASNTGSYVFSFFFICIFIVFLAISYSIVQKKCKRNSANFVNCFKDLSSNVRAKIRSNVPGLLGDISFEQRTLFH